LSVIDDFDLGSSNFGLADWARSRLSRSACVNSCDPAFPPQAGEKSLARTPWLWMNACGHRGLSAVGATAGGFIVASVSVTFLQDQSQEVRETLGDLQKNVIAAVLLVMIVTVAMLRLAQCAARGIDDPGVVFRRHHRHLVDRLHTQHYRAVQPHAGARHARGFGGS
jgi:hypothetical protein